MHCHALRQTVFYTLVSVAYPVSLCVSSTHINHSCCQCVNTVIQENMTLLEYLEKNKMSQAKLARRAGMSRAAINRLLSGSRRPSPQTMGKIFVATDGEVAPNDFFRDEMQSL